MSHCFLVLGYGIPKDILKDENYSLYLKSVFNRIYARCAEDEETHPVIIFSGARTDLFKPYRRTEAQEMIKLFKTLLQRPSLKTQTRGWKLIAETKAYSTLDNMLYAKQILERRKLEHAPLTVFGEETRKKRITALAKEIFKNPHIETIDFDQSSNRYLDPSFLEEKETNGLSFDLWALRDPAQLQKHRKLFKEKFAFLRTVKHQNHAQAIKAWWERELQNATSDRNG